MPEFDIKQANQYYQLMLEMLVQSGIPCDAEALVASLLLAYTCFGTLTEGQNGSNGPEHFKNPAVMLSFVELMGLIVAEVVPASGFERNEDAKGPTPS